MGRVYSKGACTACLRRKKKCDEKKPTCNACARLHLDCNYDRTRTAPSSRESRGQAQVIDVEGIGPVAVVRRLKSVAVHGDIEGSLVSQIPPMFMTFVTPLCEESACDYEVIWQLMLHDKAVQCALIATYSAVQGAMPKHGELSRAAYGEALKELRIRIRASHSSQDESLPLLVCGSALALLDFGTPGSSSHLMRHLFAQMTLISNIQPLDFNRDRMRPTEANVLLLVLEIITYSIMLLPYVERPDVFQELFHQARILEILNGINPKGCGRVIQSPLLSGQYTIYGLILHVTCLHRYSSSRPAETHKLDQMENMVHCLRYSIEADFRQPTSGDGVQGHYHVFGEIYQIALMCLSICLAALREPSKARVEAIDKLTLQGINRFTDVPKTPMCWSAASWPVAILAMAVRDDSDFDTLTCGIRQIMPFLDAGHVQRFEALIDKLTNLRKSHQKQTPSAECEWPPGLTLLQKQHGILS